MRYLLLLLVFPVQVFALDRTDILVSAVDDHILPGYQKLAEKSDALEAVAATECNPESELLQNAYHDAFDAWIAVSHLRFGPSETNNRAFALAYWPDAKGFTPKTLVRLIAFEDPIIDDPEAFTEVSIAARGFYALDAMIFDQRYLGNQEYSCRLIHAITVDIANISHAILADWQAEYADLILTAGDDENPIYFTQDEAIQDLLASVISGLEFTKDKRIARPLGTFLRPRPNRADAYRSGRSKRNITVSLIAVKELTNILVYGVGQGLASEINASLNLATRQSEQVTDPSEVSVSSRFELEALQSSVNAAHQLIASELGSALGVDIGFNALDGD